MNGIKFKIIRYADHRYQDDPAKIVGFNVIRENDESMSVYHEIILTSSTSGSQFVGKTNEECVDTAFSLLSGSIATSANKLLKSQDVIGSYYIPS
jgi:hypothetical protein